MATAMERHGGEEKVQSATPPLLVGIKEVARMLSVSVRTIERFMAAQRFPSPDVRIGARILWKPTTIMSWVDKESDKPHVDPPHMIPPPPKSAVPVAAKAGVKRRGSEGQTSSSTPMSAAKAKAKR